MAIDFMNKWITPETVMWGAAGVSFVLLVLSGPLARIVVSRRNDGAVRLAKILLFFTLPLLVLFPALVLLTGETVYGTPCGFYLLFFSLFCYYMGRNVGFERGRREISELIGLDAFDSIEDAQDRLYESRQRYLAHDEVVLSISNMAKGRPPPPTRFAAESRAKGNAASDVLDVMVEVEEVEKDS